MIRYFIYIRLFAIIAIIGFSLSSAHAQGVDRGIARTACATPTSTYADGTPIPFQIDPVTGSSCVYLKGGSIAILPTIVTPTDRGGTITLGGTAQNAAAANASRKSMVIQNPCSATEDLFVSVTGGATVSGAGNFADLGPCGSATIAWNGTVIQTAVSVNAATTNHRWSATETQ